MAKHNCTTLHFDSLCTSCTFNQPNWEKTNTHNLRNLLMSYVSPVLRNYLRWRQWWQTDSGKHCLSWASVGVRTHCMSSVLAGCCAVCQLHSTFTQNTISRCACPIWFSWLTLSTVSNHYYHHIQSWSQEGTHCRVWLTAIDCSQYAASLAAFLERQPNCYHHCCQLYLPCSFANDWS